MLTLSPLPYDQFVENKSYDEFGAAQIASTGGTSSTSSTVCNLRFPGQYFDAETGLHYNFHRYYDPALGRYITEDPIRDGLNWYAYAGSNPGNNIDPLGLWNLWNPVTSGQPLSPEQKLGMLIAGKSDRIEEIENMSGEIADQTQKVQVGIVMKVLPESWDTPTVRAMAGLAFGMIQSSRCRKAVNGGAGAAKATPHGNSKLSPNAQHRYEIVENSSGDVVKTGISGKPMNQNGTSGRANGQVNELNAAEGQGTYSATVPEKNLPGRQTGINAEQAATTQLDAAGNSLRLQKRPKP